MSLLRKAGKYNNIPAKLLPELPSNGTVVTFKFVNLFENTLNGEKRYADSHIFPTTSQFVDPETSEIVQIALVESVNGIGEPERTKKIRCSPQKDGGVYSITIGSNADSNDIYRYFMLMSENKSNLLRLPTVDAQVELVDNVGAAEKRNEERRKKREAMDFALALEDNQLEDIALVLGISPELSIGELRDGIEAYAEMNQKDFLLKVKNEDASIIAVIKNALRLDVVKIDGSALYFAEGMSKICDLAQPDKVSVPGEFVSFAKLKAQGPAVVAKLRELCDEKIAKANKGKGNAGKKSTTKKAGEAEKSEEPAA